MTDDEAVAAPREPPVGEQRDQVAEAAADDRAGQRQHFHFGGPLLFEQPQGFTTFVSLTAGLTRLEGSPGRYSTENEFSASLAGGLRFAFSEAVHATFGVRGYVTLVDSNTGLVCVSDPPEGTCLLTSSGNTFCEIEATAGLNFRFGGR